MTLPMGERMNLGRNPIISLSLHLIFEQAFNNVETAQCDVDAATNDVSLRRRLLHDRRRERLQRQSQMIAAADVDASFRQFSRKLVDRTRAIDAGDAIEISLGHARETLHDR